MPGADPAPHSGRERMPKERFKSWTRHVMTLPGVPPHQPALPDVSHISIMERPAQLLPQLFPGVGRAAGGARSVPTTIPAGSQHRCPPGPPWGPQLRYHPRSSELLLQTFEGTNLLDYFKYPCFKEGMFRISLVTSASAGTASCAVTSQSKLLQLFIEYFCIFLHN